MKYFTTAALLLFVAVNGAEKEFSLTKLQTQYEQELDGSSDVIKERQLLPSAEKPQGELRLVNRGNAQVIQTLLFTRYPSRFLKKMKTMEAIAWPIEMTGKSESNLYLTGVELAIDYAKKQYPFREDKDDKRKKLLVELVHSSDHSFAAFFTMELDESEGNRLISKRDVFSIVPLEPFYVKREMTLILQDAFKYDREKAADTLGFKIPDDSPEVMNAMEEAKKELLDE